jgi:hypothetical protein
MRQFRRIIQTILVLVFFIWAALKAVSSFFGIAIMIDDPGPAITVINKGLAWLFSTPWPVPAILAVFTTALVFWPRILEVSDFVLHKMRAFIAAQKVARPEARLSLLWRNQQLLLEIESLNMNRVYDVHIDLTGADVPVQNQGRYFAVWLGSQAPEQRNIPKSIHDWIEIYEWEKANEAEFRNHFYFWHHEAGARHRTKTNISQVRPLNQVYKPSKVKMDISANPEFRDGPKTIIFELEGARSIAHIFGDFEIKGN